MGSPADPLLGRTLGHYQLTERIGEGGMGEVYKAEDLKLRRTVAVKILPPNFVQNLERVHRFKREARVATSINHPHIATVYEIGRSDDIHFIAMEYVDGDNLTVWLGRKDPPLADVLRVLEQAGDALSRAHASGVLHRDLKPANVMVTKDGYAKLLDFGLAKASGTSGVLADASTEENLTRSGMVMGTMAYMSPEQAKGQLLDRRTDVFSFGILLYEAVTRRHPFGAGEGLETATSVLRDDPIPRLRDLGVRSDLVRILAKALQKDPNRRYQYVDDLVVDLRAVRRLLESGAALGDAEQRRRVSRVGWLAIGLGSGAALVGAVALLRSVTGSSTAASSPPIATPGVRTRRLTFDASVHAEPSLSPDGDRVSYASDTYGSFDIFIQHVVTGQVLRVTDDPGDEQQPSFSPDGQTILFVTRGGKVQTVPALGGVVRSLAEGDHPSWAFDGRSIVYRDKNDLFIVDRMGGAPRRLTREGDPIPLTRAAASPDGHGLYYTGFKDGSYVLARVPLEGGPTTIVGRDSQALGHIVLSADGRWLVGSSGPPRDLGNSLLALPVAGPRTFGGPLRLFGGVLDLTQPYLSRDSRKLTFLVRESRVSVARVPRALEGAPHEPARLPGEGTLMQAAVSHKGDVVVVVTNRTGRQKLWRMSARGGDLDALREGTGDDESPTWSPDDGTIAFSHIDGGTARIAVMSSSGGPMTLLSEPEFFAAFPTWSPDGKQIGFVTNEPTHSIRVLPAEGGRSRELGSTSAFLRKLSWSPDGRWIAAGLEVPAQGSRITFIPSTGGALDPVLQDAQSPLWLPDGDLVFNRRSRRDRWDLWIVPMDSRGAPDLGRARPLTQLGRGRSVEPSLGASTDGRFLYFSLEETVRSEVWLAEAP